MCIAVTIANAGSVKHVSGRVFGSKELYWIEYIAILKGKILRKM
jgi:hypothetical protein